MGTSSDRLKRLTGNGELLGTDIGSKSQYSAIWLYAEQVRVEGLIVRST